MWFKKKIIDNVKRCACKQELHLLGGTADVYFCPDCVVAQKREKEWAKRFALDGFPMLKGGDVAGARGLAC